MLEPLMLNGRLGAIVRMIPPCPCVADIGADHGMLGAHLLISNVCARVQLLDVSAPSLKKAARLIRRLGLESRAALSVGDGAQALVEHADCAVIAGMGGITIAGIVERGREALKDSLVIMQPNVGIEPLRKRLCAAGFFIVDEDIVRDGGRWYVIIAARAGEAAYTQRELVIGPVILKKRHPHLNGYAQFRLGVAKKALDGARKGGSAALEALEAEALIWEEVANATAGIGCLSCD